MPNTHWFQEAIVAISFEWLCHLPHQTWLVRNVYCLDFLTFSMRKHLLRNGLWDSVHQTCHLYSVNICIWTNHLDTTPCSQGRLRQQRWIPTLCVSAPQKRNTKAQPTPAVVIHLPLIYRDSLEKITKHIQGISTQSLILSLVF